MVKSKIVARRKDTALHFMALLKVEDLWVYGNT
jgi:hypothetical protein